MASEAREPTTVARQPSAPPPHHHISPATAAPPPTSPFDKASPLSVDAKLTAVSPRVAGVHLTGAMAEADNKRHSEEVERQKAAAMTSPNPAALNSSNNLFAAVSQQSTPAQQPRPLEQTQQKLPAIRTDAPAATNGTAHEHGPGPTPTTPGRITTTSMVDEPMEIEQASVSPATNSVATTNDVPHLKTTQPTIDEDVGSHAAPEERSNKAVTYPPPPELLDSTTPVRNNSLPAPGSSSRTSSGRKHRCPHCNTEFTRHHNLKSHLLTHSQEKPFGCDICHARFRRQHDLKRHTKLHTGERPHICPKCGRKFARGDALARHSKGPGGCAGRRGSAGGDDDDDSMEGVTYHGDEPDSDRRRSEPNSARRSTLNPTDSSPNVHHHSSTYPGQKNMPGSFVAPPIQSPSLLSPSGVNQSAYFGSNLPFPQGSVTESPKPLSPGSIEPKRPSLADSVSSYARARSPSLATHLQQQHLGRSSSHSGPSLPPPVGGSIHPQPQLPPLHPAVKPGPGPPPAPLATHALPSASASNPGSASSHNQSSAGSMRDILNNGPAPPPNSHSDLAMWEQVRSLNAENTKLKEELQRFRSDFSRIQEELSQCKKEAHISEQHYETKIRRLEDKLKDHRK